MHNNTEVDLQPAIGTTTDDQIKGDAQRAASEHNDNTNSMAEAEPIEDSADAESLRISTPGYNGPDRRQTSGRREPMGFFSFRQVSRHRERKNPGRRSEDWLNPYVDWYEPRYMALTLAIIFLTVADSLFTLLLWGRGVIELSPLMAYLVDTSTQLYVGIKISITSLGLMLMVLYKNFSFYRVLRVKHLLYILLVVYSITVYQQFVLYQQI